MEAKSFSTQLLLGVPGSRKSALLARLAQELTDQGWSVLAIKADTLSKSVKDAKTLHRFLHLARPVRACIRRVACAQKVAVLTDQLDALAELLDLDPGRLNVLLHLVRDLAEQPNVHVVCSCRTFEQRHGARLSTIDAVE